jgi:hypothetical protein
MRKAAIIGLFMGGGVGAAVGAGGGAGAVYDHKKTEEKKHVYCARTAP